jgi:cytochrome c553
MSASRIVLATLLVVGCARAPVVHSAWDGKPHREPAAEPADSPPAEDAGESELAKEMHARIDELALVGPHVVRGDVGSARALGEDLLVRIGESDGPPQWRPYVAAVRVELRALADARDLAAAAEATARVAAQCGVCHEDLDVRPRLDDEPMPTHDADPMRLHAWGMNRLREGLVAPSQDRWLQGTATFASLPGCTEPDPSRRDLCNRVKLLAHRAHVAETTNARVHLYGDLLTTCSGCHAKR